MPTIPRLTSFQTAPGVAPSVSVATPSAAALGAGLGAGLQDLGSSLNDEYVEQKRRTDKGVVTAAYAKARTAQSEFRYGEEWGLDRKKGQQFLESEQGANEAWEKRLGEIRSGLSASQQAMFDEQVAPLRLQWTEDMARWRGRARADMDDHNQAVATQGLVDSAILDAENGNIRLNPDGSIDDSSIESDRLALLGGAVWGQGPMGMPGPLASSVVDDFAMAEAERRGVPEGDARAALRREKADLFHLGVAQALSDRGDLRAAKAYLDKHGGEMTPGRAAAAMRPMLARMEAEETEHRLMSALQAGLEEAPDESPVAVAVQIIDGDPDMPSDERDKLLRLAKEEQDYRDVRHGAVQGELIREATDPESSPAQKEALLADPRFEGLPLSNQARVRDVVMGALAGDYTLTDSESARSRITNLMDGYKDRDPALQLAPEPEPNLTKYMSNLDLAQELVEVGRRGGDLSSTTADALTKQISAYRASAESTRMAALNATKLVETATQGTQATDEQKQAMAGSVRAFVHVFFSENKRAPTAADVHEFLKPALLPLWWDDDFGFDDHDPLYERGEFAGAPPEAQYAAIEQLRELIQEAGDERLFSGEYAQDNQLALTDALEVLLEEGPVGLERAMEAFYSALAGDGVAGDQAARYPGDQAAR